MGEVPMPQKIICDGCGEVLFSNLKLIPPEELIQELNGKCPHCGKKLVFNPDKVEIRIL